MQGKCFQVLLTVDVVESVQETILLEVNILLSAVRVTPLHAFLYIHMSCDIHSALRRFTP